MSQTQIRHCAIGLILLALLLTACGHERRVKHLRQTTDRIAEAINTVCVEVKNRAAENAAIIAAALANTDIASLPVDRMDVNAGGSYTWLEDWYYYPVKDLNVRPGMVVFHNVQRRIAPGSPEFRKIQQTMKFLEALLPSLKPVPFADHSTGAQWFFTAQGVVMSTVYREYPSINIDTFPGMQVFEWWQNVTPANDPDRTPRWTKEVFADLTGVGWIQTVSAPVDVQGRFEGVVTHDLNIAELVARHIRDQREMVLFLDAGMSVLGLSPSVRDALPVQAVKEFEYLELYQGNPPIPDEYKLTDPDHAPEIRQLGAHILSGAAEFEHTISGKAYTVVVSPIPEAHFYVVGLVEK